MSPALPARASAELPPQEGYLRVEGHTLRAAAALGFGQLALREAPLLRIPSELDAGSAPAVFAELAQRLGDATRLATFAAFLRLEEEKQQVLLDLGLPSGSRQLEGCQKAVAAFLRDFPEYTAALDWQLFALVVSIVSERGSLLPSGQRVVYRLSDVARHSCSPNAVTEMLTEDGLREVRVISFNGIAENEEVTVSFIPEEPLLQPTAARSSTIRELRQGYLCRCARCKLEAGDLVELWAVAEQLRHDLPELRRRCEALRRLDGQLPFAMASKARVRFKLAQACEKFLPESAKQLYEMALDETEIVLGQKGLRNADNIKRRLGQLLEQMPLTD